LVKTIEENNNNLFKKIPDDWEIKKLEEIAEVKGGKRIPKGWKLQEQPNGHPYITVADMEKGSIDLSNIKYVPKQIQTSINKYRIYSDDIYISVAGTLGLIGIVPKILNGANLTENANRITNIRCDRDYLKYYLMSEIIQKEIKNTSTVGAQPKLALTRISQFKIALPNKINEQKIIASTLSDIDELLEILEKIIDKKKKIKQGVMQQLLTGKKRLPNFNENWKNVRLGEIAEFYKGKGLPKSKLSEQGKYKCIHYGELFTIYKEKIDKIFSRTNEDGNLFKSKKNDVLMPTSDVTPNGLAVASCIQENNVLLGGDILIIRCTNRDIDGTFLSYVIRNSKSQIMQLVSGITVYHLYPSDMKEFKFKCPPTLKEQEAIVEVLLEMDSEIELLKKKLKKYEKIKEGMMQQLLTGRVRLV